MSIQTIAAHVARFIYLWKDYLIVVGCLTVVVLAVLIQLGKRVTEFNGFTAVMDRGGHATVKLEDGTVLVVGGGFVSLGVWDSQSPKRSECFLFNPGTKTWTQVASMTQARWGHTATLLQNGSVLVAGGASDASCEIYDPIKDQWKATAPLIQSRSMHTASLLPDGRVLVTGGLVQSGSPPTGSCEIYDPVSAHWTAAANLPFPCFGHNCVELHDQRILVAGGITSQIPFENPQPLHVQIYDPKTNLWKQGMALTDNYTGMVGTPLEVKQVNLETLTLLPDNTVRVDYSQNYNTPFHAVYDPDKDRWSNSVPGWDQMGDLISKHGLDSYYYTGTLTTLNDGRVLIVGGDSGAQEHGGGGSFFGQLGDGGGNLVKIRLYTPSTHKMEPVGSFPWAYPARQPNLMAAASIPISPTESAIDLLPATTEHNAQVSLSFQNGQIIVKLENTGPGIIMIVSHLRYRDGSGVYAIERNEANFQLLYGTLSLLSNPGWQPLNTYSPDADYPDALEELFPQQSRQYAYNPDSYTVAWGTIPEKNSSMDISTLLPTFHGDRANIHKNLRARVLIKDKEGSVWPVWSNSIALTDEQLYEWRNLSPSVGYENFNPMR